MPQNRVVFIYNSVLRHYTIRKAKESGGALWKLVH